MNFGAWDQKEFDIIARGITDPDVKHIIAALLRALPRDWRLRSEKNVLGGYTCM
jgi:hypothetical protein